MVAALNSLVKPGGLRSWPRLQADPGHVPQNISLQTSVLESRAKSIIACVTEM